MAQGQKKKLEECLQWENKYFYISLISQFVLLKLIKNSITRYNYSQKNIKVKIFYVLDEKTLANKFRGNLELYFDSIIKGTEFKKSSVKKELIWVDDRPENNVYERNSLEKYGLDFTLALSTQQALHYMRYKKFALVISDIGRKEGKKEGYVLLDAIRKNIQFIIYTGLRKQEHINETLERGGQGCTNNPKEPIDLVIKIFLNN